MKDAIKLTIYFIVFCWIIIGTIMVIDQYRAKYTEEDSIPDQCLRREFFQKCLAGIPDGPQELTAAANDWSEVVDSCSSAAYYQSFRKDSHIKRECK